MATSEFETLKVTSVQVFRLSAAASVNNIKAVATVVLNDQLVIRSLRVIDGETGLFVGYPADPFYRGADTRFVVHPITRALRDTIENAVLERYQQVK